MPDNLPIDPSTGPNAQPVATDEIGGVHYQIIKPAFGADGSATPVSAADPMPTADETARATLQAINDLSDSMLYLLSAMLEKMPRLTSADRIAVDASEVTVARTDGVNVGNNCVSSFATGAYISRMFEPQNFADMGAARLYQQIQVS